MWGGPQATTESDVRTRMWTALDIVDVCSQRWLPSIPSFFVAQAICPSRSGGYGFRPWMWAAWMNSTEKKWCCLSSRHWWLMFLLLGWWLLEHFLSEPSFHSVRSPWRGFGKAFHQQPRLSSYSTASHVSTASWMSDPNMPLRTPAPAGI